MPFTQHLEQLQSMQLLLLCAHGVGDASAGAVGPDASGVLQQLGTCWVQSRAARQLNSKSCRQVKCFIPIGIVICQRVHLAGNLEDGRSGSAPEPEGDEDIDDEQLDTADIEKFKGNMNMVDCIRYHNHAMLINGTARRTQVRRTLKTRHDVGVSSSKGLQGIVS